MEKGWVIAMNKEWSLDVLYKSYEDENYISDKGKLDRLIKEINEFCGLLSGSNEEESLLKAVDYMEQLQLLASRMGCYLYSRQAVNTSDAETANEISNFDKEMSFTTKPLAVLKKFIAGIDGLETYYGKYPKLKGYEYLFSEYKKEARYLLSDEVEDVIARLNISAGLAWSNMQDFLTSTLEVEYRDNVITLSEVRNKAYDEDKEIRRDAYVAEVKALEKIKDATSYALNSIKTQVTTICELRGYQSPLEMTLIGSKMKRETLDALLDAIREFLPAFHRYLKHKAKLLGHEKGLPWYDLFAPLGESNLKFTAEESGDYLVSHFRSFNDELADMVAKAYSDEWIDFYPRKGKVGGAFCENMPFVKQSRILTNYEGSLSDVITLAHELAIHIMA